MAFALGSFVGVGTRARLLAATQSQQTQSPPSSPSGQSSQHDRAEMMKMDQQMMADMKAADGKLDQLVKDMNAAKGEATERRAREDIGFWFL